MGMAGEVSGVSDHDKASDEQNEEVIEQMLKRSLFAPPITNAEDAPPTPDSGTIQLPPLTDPDLAQLGDHYSALWFTYQYFDTGPSRLIEECTETLRVGHVTATLSPDVLHRLQHFIHAFGKSLEANRRFSEGELCDILNLTCKGGTRLSYNFYYDHDYNCDHDHDYNYNNYSIITIIMTISSCNLL